MLQGRVHRGTSLQLAALFIFAIACSGEEPAGGGAPPSAQADATPLSSPDAERADADAGPLIDGDGGLVHGTDATGPFVPNPQDPANAARDSDCDGLSDAYEFSTIYPGGMKTSPSASDTDGDGLSDGLEMGRTSSVAGSNCTLASDADPNTHTSPVHADTDNDGVADGAEDTNRNGRVDATESNPTASDTDGDSVPDGIEDANRDGRRDAGELDPTQRDSDSDGIADGIEDADRDGTFDAGETNPLAMDTDGDSVLDGDEDTNHDGVRQTYEIDPRSADTDCDGIGDGDELTRGTSPVDADSDGDGVSDGVEIGRTMALSGSSCPSFTPDTDPQTTTNPLDADSDGDGLTDGTEDADHDGAADPTETNTNNRDSDGDGLSDGDEVLIGANPRDPASPDAGFVQSVTAICDDRNLQPIDFHTGGMGDWTVAVRPAVQYQAVTVRSMDVHVGALDNAMSEFAGFVVEMPAFTGAATLAAQDAALRGRLGSGGQGLTNTVRQSPRNITSHDGFSTAVSAVVDVTSAQRNAAQVRNSLLSLITGLAPSEYTGLPVATGGNGTAWAFTYQILVRPSGRILVVGAVMSRARFEDPADASGLEIVDLTNGTALARKDAGRGKACDSIIAQSEAVADFIWMADISGSTDDDRGRIVSAAQQVFDALRNNGVDFRMGVVPHSSNAQASGTPGTLRGVGFTTDRTQFTQYLRDTAGTDGCEFGLLATDAAIAGALPRTPAGSAVNPRKLRERAVLAVVYVSDEHDESIEEQEVCDNLPRATNCLTGVRDVFEHGESVCTVGPNAAQQTCIDRAVRPFISRIQGQQGIAFGQVVASTPLAACNTGHFRCQNSAQDRNEPGLGYLEVINATGGLFYSPCDANPGPGPLTAIVNAVTGAASEFRLTGAPISSAIKVGVTRSSGGNVVVVPRHKQNGFDYDPARNAIYFHGATYRPQLGDRVTISYRVWKRPTSPCGPCAAPQVCDPVLGVCTCDAALCSACGPNQACDSNCNCACAADCNGTCGPSEVCDAQTCQCECAPDCGGCPTGTACNPNTCACECTSDCGGACNGTSLVCNSAACNCQCPSDCGGACDAATCNPSTCACDCGPGCNEACSGRAACNPSKGCACECPANCGGCPDGTLCDATSCECECPAGCNSACVNRQVCDPNNDCACACPVDCGGCNPGESCDPLACRCVPAV